MQLHRRYVKKRQGRSSDATVESIRELVPLIESAVGQNYLCVVGNQKQINEARDLFDEIKPLSDKMSIGYIRRIR